MVTMGVEHLLYEDSNTRRASPFKGKSDTNQSHSHNNSNKDFLEFVKNLEIFVIPVEQLVLVTYCNPHHKVNINSTTVPPQWRESCARY